MRKLLGEGKGSAPAGPDSRERCVDPDSTCKAGGGAKGLGKAAASGGLTFQGMYNSRPTGYGHQGICWNCGKVGHKSAECTELKAVDEDGGAGNEETTTLHVVWDLTTGQGSSAANRGCWSAREEEEKGDYEWKGMWKCPFDL